MNKAAQWSMDEYFRSKGISIDGDAFDMLSEHLEGLVAHIGNDMPNAYHDKYVEESDKRIINLENALLRAANDLAEVESITFEYDFTEGGYEAEEAMRITSKIITHARTASRVAEDTARSDR